MTLPVHQIVDKLRVIHRQDRAAAPANIEAYLDNALADLPGEERPVFIQRVARHLISTNQLTEQLQEQDGSLQQFAELLLGQPVDMAELDRQQLQERLYETLTAIFNGVNQLLLAINQTMSRDGLMDETIRQVVRGQLEGQRGEASLESHIDRIKEAFFTSYESSKAAHLTVIEDILSELDPEKFSTKSGGVKFGPLRRADAYDQFVNTYKNLKSWHQSGRGLEAYLRAFEKHCGDASSQHKEVTF